MEPEITVTPSDLQPGDFFSFRDGYEPRGALDYLVGTPKRRTLFEVVDVTPGVVTYRDACVANPGHAPCLDEIGSSTRVIHVGVNDAA